MNTPADQPTGSLVEIGPGAYREAIADGKIVCFTVKNPPREGIDAWVQAYLSMLEDFPAETPMLILNDMTAIGLGLTQYARNRAIEIINRGRKLTRDRSRDRLAIVVGSPFLAQAVTLFLGHGRGMVGFRSRAFTSRARAIEWLLED